MKYNSLNYLVQLLIVIVFLGGLYLFIKPEESVTPTQLNKKEIQQKDIKKRTVYELYLRYLLKIGSWF